MSQYTVYTRLRKPFHPLRTAIFVFQSLSPDPLGCNEISLYLWLPVPGKFLAIDRSLNPKGQWEHDVGEDDSSRHSFWTPMSPSSSLWFQTSRSFWCFKNWHYAYCVFQEKSQFHILKLYYPAKHSLFSESVQLSTSQTSIICPPLSRLLTCPWTTWIDLIFFFTVTTFTQINILSKEASYHHSECRISIRAANRSMY